VNLVSISIRLDLLSTFAVPDALRIKSVPTKSTCTDFPARR
jgi:hypothetical protein